MSGSRWRLVESQNNKRFVCTVAMSEEEARESLALEASMHEQHGWIVTRGENADGDLDTVICRKPSTYGRPAVLRAITLKEFGPLDDLRPGGDE